MVCEMIESLNPRQREAVTYCDGPQVVLAGAGSGKTKVLTTKIAYLIEERHVRPWRILALTFTNKAAREMKSRAEAILDGNLQGLEISTFHAYGLRFLHRYSEALQKLGHPYPFVIFDRGDTKAVVKRAMAELNIDPKKLEMSAALDMISQAKTKANPVSREPKISDRWRSLYDRYQEQLRTQGALDFDDLMVLPLHILATNKEVLEHERSRLDWVLVDEYQDVNHPQYLMLRCLVDDGRKIMVVGDPDQSIYGWRGANYATIMNFERDFPNARVTLLEQNYRSTAMILDASNQLIRHNKNRREKNLRTNREEGQKVGVWYLRDEKAEAEALAREIVGLTAAYHYGDIAVLYRMNALSRVLEQALIEAGIPYRIVRGTSFYDRKEVRDVVAFMRLAVNPWDLVALNRVGNLPARALGPKSLEKLGVWMRENAKGAAEDVWGTVKAKKGGLTGKAAEGAETDIALRLELDGTGQSEIDSGVGFLDHMLTLLERQHSLPLVLDWILNGVGYENLLMKAEPADWEERVENVRELLSVAPEGENLAEVLDQVSLYTDMDTQNETRDAVNLSSLHAAKGLEFPVVFMTGMEEGIFPHSRSSDSQEELEEERRLCYVGMTRAEEKLYMSGARQRRLFGVVLREGFSRFLAELPDECTEVFEQKEEPERYGYGRYRPYRRAGRW